MRIILNIDTLTSPISLSYASESKTDNQVTFRIKSNFEKPYLIFEMQDSSKLHVSDAKIDNGMVNYDLDINNFYNPGVIKLYVQGGANLFPGWIIGTGINPTTGVITSSSGSAISTDYIPVDFSTNSNYYLSGLSNTINSFVAAYNSNKEFLGRTSGSERVSISLNSGSFWDGSPTATGEIAYLRVTQYGNSDTITAVNNLKTKLNIGTKPIEDSELEAKEIIININEDITSNCDLQAKVTANNEYQIYRYTGADVEYGGEKNYNDLDNKPSINGVELVGNKTTEDLGINVLVDEQDPTVPTHVKDITLEDIDRWNLNSSGGSGDSNENEGSTGTLDYNLLYNKPITNLQGTSSSPINLSQLGAGVYTIKGYYRINASSEVLYSENMKLYATPELLVNNAISISKWKIAVMDDVLVEYCGD